MRRSFFSGCAALSLVLLAGPALAQKGKKPKEKPASTEAQIEAELGGDSSSSGRKPVGVKAPAPPPWRSCGSPANAATG